MSNYVANLIITFSQKQTLSLTICSHRKKYALSHYIWMSGLVLSESLIIVVYYFHPTVERSTDNFFEEILMYYEW